MFVSCVRHYLDRSVPLHPQLIRHFIKRSHGDPFHPQFDKQIRSGRQTIFGRMVGSLFGWMVVQALSDLGISQFVVPGGRLSQAVVMAALAGVLAAIVPARKAARTDVLRALEAQ